MRDELDDGVVDVGVGIVEGGVRASSQRTGANCQRTRLAAKGPGAKTTGPGNEEIRRQAPRPNLILRCSISIANLNLSVGHHCENPDKRSAEYFL